MTSTDPPALSEGKWMQVWNDYKSYVKHLLWLSWPNILTSLIQLALPITSTLAVGHIGSSSYIGAAALANMFANATGFAVGSGLAMALDTLCSQAFGAKKYYLVGLYCQRAMVILTIVCVPVVFGWWNAWYVLQYIGTAETAVLSQFYIRRLIPSLWPRIMYDTYRRYLLAQRVMWPMTASIAIVIPFHIMNTYLFIFYFGFGFGGAAYATAISYWLLFLSLLSISQIRISYLRRRASIVPQELADDEDVADALDSTGLKVLKLDGADEVEEDFQGDLLHTWPPWSLDVFRGWLAYFRLGIATTLSLVIEWGSFEVNAAIAARVGQKYLDAHAIMSNVVAVWYATPFGVASASTAIIGNMLGAGDANKAKIYARIAFTLAIIWGIANGGIGMTYRNQLGALWTDDKDVISIIASNAPILWVYGIVDAAKAIGMAVLRGCGRPILTVYGNVLSCLIIGYPVAFLLVFWAAHLELHGVWIGMSAAWFSAATLYAILIARTDWSLEVLKAAQRNKEALLSTKHGREKAQEGELMDVLTNGEGEGQFSVAEDEKASFLAPASQE